MERLALLPRPMGMVPPPPPPLFWFLSPFFLSRNSMRRQGAKNERVLVSVWVWLDAALPCSRWETPRLSLLCMDPERFELPNPSLSFLKRFIVCFHGPKNLFQSCLYPFILIYLLLDLFTCPLYGHQIYSMK